MMCCCLLADEDAPDKRTAGGATPTASMTGSPVQLSPHDHSEYSTRGENAPMLMAEHSQAHPSDPNRIRLLGRHHPDDNGKKCLVLDLDETLVHSSFRAVPGADFVIPVQVRISLQSQILFTFRCLGWSHDLIQFPVFIF
jgi:hypothetical protein